MRDPNVRHERKVRDPSVRHEQIVEDTNAECGRVEQSARRYVQNMTRAQSSANECTLMGRSAKDQKGVLIMRQLPK